LHRHSALACTNERPDCCDLPFDRHVSRQSSGAQVHVPARARKNLLSGDRAMTFDLQLAGRRALVSAGTKGIGAAVVQALSDAGARVAATARAQPANAVRDVFYISG